MDEHPLNPKRVLIQCTVPSKSVPDGMKQWLEPDMREIKVKYRVDPANPQTWYRLIGRMVRVPELERKAEKLGYKMVKRRKVVG